MDILTNIIKFIKIVAMLISLAVWAVIGFVFWVPLLARSIFAFSISVLYVTLTRQNPTSIGYQLSTAASFYVMGFVNIIEAIFPEDSAETSEEEDFEVHFGRLLLEILWSAFCWITLLLSLGYLQWLTDFLKAAFLRITGA